MSLRTEMPTTAAIIDALREAFGREGIDAQIRKGMQGIPGFWARENGHEVGARMPDPVGYITVDQMVIEKQTEDANANRKPR